MNSVIDHQRDQENHLKLFDIAEYHLRWSYIQDRPLSMIELMIPHVNKQTELLYKLNTELHKAKNGTEGL